MTEAAADNFELGQLLRSAEPGDFDEIRALFHAGVGEGHVRENDTGADIEDLEAGYFSDEGDSCFWVATHGDEIIGMIGVQKTSDNVAEVRRLRVRHDFRRRGVGTKLMEQALVFCQRKGYLKVMLDVRIELEPARALFEKSGFTLARTREISGRKTLDFYLDLYRDPGG